MVKLCASLIVANGCVVRADNGNGDTADNRCGAITYVSNMSRDALAGTKPTQQHKVLEGEIRYDSLLKMKSDYDPTLMVPILGQLKDGEAKASGICAKDNYALSLVAGKAVESKVGECSLRRLSGLYDGFDQVFLANETSARINAARIKIGNATCNMPSLEPGEIWTTTVPTGFDVSFDGTVPSTYTVYFDSNGGSVDEASRDVDVGNAVGGLPTPTWSNYTFDGWWTAAEGGEAVTAETVIVDDVTVYAHWTKNVEPDPEPEPEPTPTPEPGPEPTPEPGPEPTPEPTPGPEPEPTPGPEPEPGPQPAPTPAPVPDPTPAPMPEPEPQPEPTPEPEIMPVLHEVMSGAAPTTAASEYNGYLYDEKSGDVKGTIHVKVGKPGKDGAASVKATVVVGTKKVTLKAKDKGKAVIEKDGPTEIELVGGEACEIALGAEGLSGCYGAYQIDGSRNFFSSKDKGEVAVVNDILSKWLGSLMVVWDGGSLNVNLASKGKVKVSGTLANGKKVSASTVLLVGEEWSCVSVAVPKSNLAFVLWLSGDGGTAMAEGLGDGVHVGRAGSLASGAAFCVPTDDELWDKIPGDVHTEYLPDGVPVTQKGTKWTLPKAGKITMKKGKIDESKKGDNPSGLKLTYKSKDGSFKGSFKVYAENKGKLKATTVNVTGFLLDGVGYGTATVKGKGSVAVTIE